MMKTFKRILPWLAVMYIVSLVELTFKGDVELCTYSLIGGKVCTLADRGL